MPSRDTSNYRLRKVVTSFIVQGSDQSSSSDNRVCRSLFRATESTRILLLKRSSKVRSYKGHWCGCSGSIEEGDSSPFDRACREIEEELSLKVTDDGASDVVFWRHGRPMRIVDDELETDWRVFTFLWVLRKGREGNIKIDWEHDEMRWVRPDELTEMQLVPRMEETFQTVFLSPSIDSRVLGLYNNHTAGAKHLALYSLDTLRHAIADLQNQDGDDASSSSFDGDRIQSYLCNIVYQLTATRPCMDASISHVLLTGLRFIREALSERGGDGPKDGIYQTVLSAIDRARAESECGCVVADNAISKIADITNEYSSGQLHLATLSSSSLVLAIFARLIRQLLQGEPSTPFQAPRFRSLKITIAESRPLFEGVLMARKLRIILEEEKAKMSRVMGNGNALNGGMNGHTYTNGDVDFLPPNGNGVHHDDPDPPQPKVIVEICTDASFSSHIHPSTVVLLAADRVLPSSLPPLPPPSTTHLSKTIQPSLPAAVPMNPSYKIVNKVGSLTAAWLGRTKGKATLVICGTDKIGRQLNPENHFEPSQNFEEQSESEVLEAWTSSIGSETADELGISVDLSGAGSGIVVGGGGGGGKAGTMKREKVHVKGDMRVDVRNVYFEEVGMEHVNCLVTERGPLGALDVLRLADQKERNWKEVMCS